MFSIKVLNADRETKFAVSGEREAYLVVDAAYEEGDSVVLEYSGEPRYFVFQHSDRRLCRSFMATETSRPPSTVIPASCSSFL